MHVQSNDNLAVTSTPEDIAGGIFNLLAYAVIVVELSVDRGVDLAIRGVKWLGPVGREVIDREPYVAESYILPSAW